MPVPEIDRLAHEILDILGGDPSDTDRPKSTGSLADRTLVAISRKVSKIDATSEPLKRGVLECLHAGYLGLQQGSPIWNHPSGEFERGPVPALLGLYAALERAEMQERATPTPNLHADDPSFLAPSGNPHDNVTGHE